MTSSSSSSGLAGEAFTTSLCQVRLECMTRTKGQYSPSPIYPYQRAKPAKAKSTKRKEPAIEIPQRTGFDVSELNDFYDVDVGSSETSQTKVSGSQPAVHGQGDQQGQPRESLGGLQPVNPFKIPEPTTQVTNTSSRLSTDHQLSQVNRFKIPESTSKQTSSRLSTDHQAADGGLDREHGQTHS